MGAHGTRMVEPVRFGISAILLGALFAGSHSLAQEHATRTLTGTVEDRHHEPLKGAIVEVQIEDTENVVSYITDVNGQFSFKRLSWNVDYRVWATYRGQKCHSQEMSHFDSKPAKVLHFVIDLP
jgi:hypothetical protein